MARPSRAGKHNWLCAHAVARGRHDGARGKASSLWLGIGWGRQAALAQAPSAVRLVSALGAHSRPAGLVAVLLLEAAYDGRTFFALVLAGAGDGGDADLAVAVVERGSLACGALLLLLLSRRRRLLRLLDVHFSVLPSVLGFVPDAVVVVNWGEILQAIVLYRDVLPARRGGAPPSPIFRP